MENNQQTGGTKNNAKNQNKHLFTSLIILGAALAVVIIIAVVSIIMNIGATLSTDGTKLNGSSANELYSDIRATIEGEDNYEITLTKHGGAMLSLTGSTISVNVVSDITAKVDGNNFYYKSVTRTNYIAPKETDNADVTVTMEIRVVDGVAYIKTDDEMMKYTVTVDDYKNDFDAIKMLIWEDGKLFNNAKFEKTDESYSVALTAKENELKAVLAADTVEFFSTEYSVWVSPLLPMFYNINYAVSYDDNIRPTAIKYDYDLGGTLLGEVVMNSEITYGNAHVELPENVSDYKEITPEQDQ